MQNDGIREDRDDIRTTQNSVQTENAEPTDPDDGFSLQSTMGSYEVEEIAGGYLGLWILRHYWELYKRRGTTRTASR
jgi:hypothetical protein